MIKLIACVDRNMGIGKDNKLLTHLPKDLEHFKKTTNNHTVVFGKKTWDSLPKKPLPNRVNLVMTRGKYVSYNGIIASTSLIMAFSEIYDVFICGGETLYRQFLPYADELIISHMDADFEADTFFPAIGEEWTVYDKESVEDKVNFEIKYYTKTKVMQ